MKNQKGESTIEGMIGLVILFFIIVIIVIKATGGISAEYSTGERTGIPVKVSYKGILCKTWEGQLNMGAVSTRSDGSVTTLWAFTVQDENLVKQINDASEKGKRVSLTYSQPFMRGYCSSSSGYFITGVKVLD